MSAALSEYATGKIVRHAAGKESWTMPTSFYVTLTTVVPTAASTGSSITEISVTGFARIHVEASKLTATTGTPSVIKNNAELTTAALSGSTQTAVGWVATDASTAGNSIWWGTVPSTVLGAGNTPGTIAAEILKMELQ